MCVCLYMSNKLPSVSDLLELIISFQSIRRCS